MVEAQSRPIILDEPCTSTYQAELDNCLLHADKMETNDHQHTPLSSSEKKIGGNLDSCYNPELAKDQNAFILVDSRLLCSFLSCTVKCEVCSAHLQTRISEEDIALMLWVIAKVVQLIACCLQLQPGVKRKEYLNPILGKLLL